MGHQTQEFEAARGGDEKAFAQMIEPHRRELRAHCYRMAGSIHDADDLLQESLLRAWRGLSGFERRSSLRTWLYTIATRTCLDVLEKKAPRLLPMDFGPATDALDASPRSDVPWLEPFPDEPQAMVASPEARYGQRESVALAFLVALQLLPPKQRAVLLLREVLGWQATECAELLGLSVASVNSALQRARETLASRAGALRAAPPPIGEAELRSLLARYVRAWERADIDELVSILHEEVTLAMPPYSQWLVGPAPIRASIQAMVFGPAGPGAFHLDPIHANGQPGFAVYQRDPASGVMKASALHLLEARGDRLVSMMAFLDPALFARFGLPNQAAVGS